MVTLKDREVFSLKVTNVAPAGECATFKSTVLKTFVLYHNLLLPTVCPLDVDLQLSVFLSPYQMVYC